MFESISLRSFQKHERLDVDLSAPIVVITGSSDAGKSSVLRALRWVCLGIPPRSPMPTWGSDKVRVKLKVDGRTIERKQSKSENVYLLDGKRFAAVGRGNVPDGIAALLNVNETSFALQHQSHFWLADTPGEVARQLNAAVNLDLIDSSLANVASELRDAKHEEAMCHDRLAEAEANVDRLKWAEDADKDLKRLESMGKKVEAKQQESDELALLVREGKKADGASKAAMADCVARQKALDVIGKIAARHAGLTTESRLLGSLIEEYRCRTSKADELKAKADGLEQELSKVAVCPACNRPL